MSLSRLFSKPNLILAWRRITSSKDVRYKNYFRHLIEAYELSYEDNIKYLYYRLKNDKYKPHSSVRIYYPKASGLQRPISLLCLEDQIVYQAIANLYAEKVRDRRQNLIGKSVYSNWLGKKNHPEFFLRDWKLGFSSLRTRMIYWYKKGYSFMMEFDLAAFYDTIPHDLLLKVIAPKGGNSELIDFISKCLKTWTSEMKSYEHGHGIPQGPIASDFLAECIMLPIDERMQLSYKYLRYVDDIRILGQSELEVQNAIVDLDILCRERGLIPSSEKTGIIKIADQNHLVEKIPAVPLYGERTSNIIVNQKDLEAEFKSAFIIENSRIKVVDKTKFRYTLFRSGPSDFLLRTVKNLWEHNPYFIDVFSSFLENYSRDDEIIYLCLEAIKSSPYDFVRGEAWKLLSRMCYTEERKLLLDTAIQASKLKKFPATKIGVYIFLLGCEQCGLGRHSKWMMFEKSSLIQAIVLNNYLINQKDDLKLVNQILKRRLPDPSLALAMPFVSSKLTLDQLEKDISDIHPVAQNVFSVLGIIQSVKKIRSDIIGDKLNSRFKIVKWNKWITLLGSEYQHAHMFLVIAEKNFKINRSFWLAQQDAFNDALFRAFQSFLRNKNAPGNIMTIYPNGTLINYGKMLNNLTFTNAYPNLAYHLKEVHNRRNRLPSSHPYEIITGQKAIPLKIYEQRSMVAHLSSSYTEIMNILTRLGI